MRPSHGSCGLTSSPARTPISLCLEALERRTLLSGVAVQPDGTLLITGTDAADTVDLTGYVNTLDESIFLVTLNGVEHELNGTELGITKVQIDTGDGNDSVSSGFGDAYRALTSFPVSIDLGSGDDYLLIYEDSGGNTSAIGGTGNDTLELDHEWSTIDEFDAGAGTDTVLARKTSNGVDLRLFPTVENFSGSAYFVIGNELDNLIDLSGAGDFFSIYGMGGNDTLLGSESGTLVDGGEGDDLILGGDSENDTDILIGGAGNDTINAQAGDDWIQPGAGDDSVDGGAGTDTVLVSSGADTLASIESIVNPGGSVSLASDGTLLISGTISADAIGVTPVGQPGLPTLLSVVVNGVYTYWDLNHIDRVSILGGSGNDDITVIGNPRPIIANGQAGNDSLHFLGIFTRFGPVPTLTGGTGDDQFFTWVSSNSVISGKLVLGIIDGGDGVDALHVSQSVNAQLDMRDGLDVENLISADRISEIIGNGLDNVIEVFGRGSVTGGGGDDTLISHTSQDVTLQGGDGNDYLWGGSGNDTLDGGAGNDTLGGGLGADDLHGGDGWDTLSYFSRTNPLIVSLGNEANDGEIGEGDNAHLDIEVLYGGQGDDFLSGSDFANEIYGFAGHDTIKARGGNDIVWGGTGNDTIEGEAGDDLLYGADGHDIIRGNSGNDQIRGGNGNDWLRGDNGSDALFGQNNDDTLDGGTGADWHLGGDGQDLVNYYGRSGDLIISLDHISGNDGESGEGDTVWSDVEIVYGGSGNDRITAGSGSQSLFGFDGNDTLIGGAAKDWLYGGNGTDSADDDDKDVRFSIEQLIA